MPLFLVHAVLMGAGFLMTAAALVVAMTQRRKRWWLRTHRVLGLAGAAAMLLGSAAAVAAVAALPKPQHFASPHTWVGALTIALVAGAAALGLLQL
ncbi:MAG: cytochrome b family protein, partial [Syntrophales bacterium]